LAGAVPAVARAAGPEPSRKAARRTASPSSAVRPAAGQAVVVRAGAAPPGWAAVWEPVVVRGAAAVAPRGAAPGERAAVRREARGGGGPGEQSVARQGAEEAVRAVGRGAASWAEGWNRRAVARGLAWSLLPVRAVGRAGRPPWLPVGRVGQTTPSADSE